MPSWINAVRIWALANPAPTAPSALAAGNFYNAEPHGDALVSGELRPMYTFDPGYVPTAPPAGADGTQVYSTAGNFTFAIPAGVESLTINVQSADGSNSAHATGGSGATAFVALGYPLAAPSISVTVGARGSNSSAAIGSTSLTCTSGGNASGSTPGGGGGASGGNLNINGATGGGAGATAGTVTIDYSSSCCPGAITPSAGGQLAIYDGNGNTLEGLTGVAGSVLITNSSGIAGWSTDLPTAITIGGAYIYRAGGAAVSPTDGGTGLNASGAAAGTVPTADGSGNFDMVTPFQASYAGIVGARLAT